MNLPQARAYKTFKIGELFDIHPTSAYKLTNRELFARQGETPLVSNSSTDNGIVNYVDFPATEHGNMITFSDTTTSDAIFYQPDAFIGYPHVQGLYAKEDVWTEKSLLYFLAHFKAATSGRFDYATKFTRKIATEIEITLPVLDDGTIDFAFTEAYIRELEVARIRELEAYFVAAGFTDCELTDAERQAIQAFANGKINVQDFRISELFSVETPKRRFNANAVKFGGVHPYVVRTSQNNGQRGTIYEDREWLNSGNTISFGQDTATIFYQPEDYFTGDKIKVMRSLYSPFNERIACYYLATMRKAFSMFAWGRSSFNEKILGNVIVRLPISSDGAIDIDFMETFICGTMKLAIRGIVEWKDKEIAATRKVCESC